MRTFAHPFSVPPGRVWFYQTTTGRYVESRQSFDDLLLKVRMSLEADGREVPADLPALIQDFMCAQLPEGFCVGAESGNHPRSWRPDYFIVLNSTTAMAKAAEAAGGYGRQMMQDLERRGAACASCPLHDMTMCIGCNGILAAFDHYRVGRRTPYDSSLRVCAGCAGALPVMIHMDAKFAKPLRTLPESCWIRKELENAG